jgi:alpha-tubulin suppressor-like RCC1 family protein
VLDIEGTAWLFGRNQPAALGVPGVDAISENAPRSLRATDLGAPPGTKFVSAACGRSHSVLVASNGRVWTAGLNSLGQVGIIDIVQLCPLTQAWFDSKVWAHALPGS